MTDEYLITVVTSQTIEDDDTDSAELVTTGSYIMKNGKRYIMYKEYNDDTPPKSHTTLVKISDDNNVTISRRGAIYSDLVLEKGCRHQCHYETPMGTLIMGIYTEKIKNNLTDNGGEIFMEYCIDFNSDFVSKNTCSIKVIKKQ